MGLLFVGGGWALKKIRICRSLSAKDVLFVIWSPLSLVTGGGGGGDEEQDEVKLLGKQKTFSMFIYREHLLQTVHKHLHTCRLASLSVVWGGTEIVRWRRLRGDELLEALGRVYNTVS